MNNNPNHGNNRKEKKMNVITKTVSVAVFVALGLALPAGAREVVEVIGAATPWRAYLVLANGVYREGDQIQYRTKEGKLAPFDPATVDPSFFRVTPQPAATWVQADFDDSAWPRYQGDLADFLGGYGVGVGETRLVIWWPNRLCLRTAFGVTDPAKATDLRLTIVCIGGAVAYVNGQEVGRGHLPAGALHPLTPAECYPVTAYTTEDGATPLPGLGQAAAPEAKWLDRYAQHVRTVTINIPARLFVKGRNTLAIALHAAPIAGPLSKDSGWAHMGFRSATLTSASGAGVSAYAEACNGTHLWSANALDQVTAAPAEKSLIKPGMQIYWGRGLPVKGVQQGNPFDPVRPVRLTVPRNGTGSGQAVLSDPAGLENVSATLDALKGPGGATLPTKAVQIRYAAQHDNIHYCDALLAAPPAGVKTVPVWLIVQAPKDQAPGWYASTLRLAANSKTFTVPVQVLVTGLTLPDAKDFTSTVGMTQSPDTIAQQYGVPLWSDAHFRLLEPSFVLLGQVGNDVIHVPVIVSGVGGSGKTAFKFAWSPLIRWQKTDGGLKPDFTVLEKYLDTYTKHCASPRAISLYIWGESSAKETAQGYENRRIPTRENTSYAPPRIQVWDPATREVTEQQVPALGDEGSEAFWKPMLDGVRALVVKRGWSERIIALGLGGDIRPGEKTVNLLKAWAPYARWNYLSHFSGDPRPKDGKMIATGGAEIAVMECPDKTIPGRGYHGTGLGPLDMSEDEMQNPLDFLRLPTSRWLHQEYSPPLIFRTISAGLCSIGRLGLDFWKARAGGPRSTSFFSHVNSLTVPGPDGALPTLQFQMLRENVQDWEIKRMLIAAYLKLPNDKRGPYRDVLNELGRRVEFGTPFYLSQSELQYDWPSYVARLHETAADLLGAKSEARWAEPPPE